MGPADVLARVDEAEAMMGGLAVPGTASHTALLHLQAALDSSTVPSRSVLAAGLDALAEQALLSLRAGQHALAVLRPVEQAPHWTTGTAHEWQRYLRWLVSTLDRVASVAGSDEPWRRADTACARAREVWGAVAGSASHGADTRHDLTTVVVDGRTYVSVEELAGSLRGRAGAFADAAAASARADDPLGALVAEELAGELAGRADALDLAGIELAGTDPDDGPPPGR